jgi:hypothetical protein
MVSEKAAYWMAVGVLALFASNQFAARHEDGVRRFASQSLAVIEQVSRNATGFMATAQTMFGRSGVRFAQTQTTLACAQTRLASVQTLIAQHEGALARVQAGQSRMFAMQELHVPVICPRERIRMSVSQRPHNGI